MGANTYRLMSGFAAGEVPEGQEGTVSITGDDVTAWVEVAFEDIGWVRFDPAPDEDEDAPRAGTDPADAPGAGGAGTPPQR